MQNPICPKCNSAHIVTKDTAKTYGGIIGTTGGAISGAAAALAGDGGIDGIANHQADDDGQRQCAQAVAFDDGELRSPCRHGSDRARQQQARNHAAGLVHPAVRGCGVFECCSVHRALLLEAKNRFA